MPAQTPQHSRRLFLKTSVATMASVTIVKPHVLGGPGRVPPSETLGGALIGVGGRGPGTYNDLKGKHKLNVIKLAECDVKWVGKADNKKRYTDFRRVLERKDIDVVAIATPPHWHALISIAAMEAGKDVVSEKPMTRFIAEGRAVADAEKRYGRVYQVGTYGRFGRQGDARARARRKLMKSGLVKNSKGVLIMHRGYKVKQWSGLVNTEPQQAPAGSGWQAHPTDRRSRLAGITQGEPGQPAGDQHDPRGRVPQFPRSHDCQPDRIGEPPDDHTGCSTDRGHVTAESCECRTGDDFA